MYRDSKGRFAKKPEAVDKAVSPAPPARKSKSKKKKITCNREVQPIFCLDASGSMNGLRARLVETYNSFMKTTLDSREKVLNPVIFRFNNLWNRIVMGVHSTMSVDMHPATGGTALNDALRVALCEVPDIDDGRDYLLFVITDGEENCSHTRLSEVNAIIKGRLFTNKGFTPVFAGPPGSRTYANLAGFPQGNIQEWEVTDKGLATLSIQTNTALGEFYTSGLRSTDSFYSAS